MGHEMPDKPPTKFNDPIYGDLGVELPRFYMQVVDTPEFQRQRNLSQLGAGRRVFHSALHSRLEHAIGTGNLAHKAALSLRRHVQENLSLQESPECHVSDLDVRVMTVAGLCCNLGHGPYGEAFEMAYERLLGKSPEGRKHRVRTRSAAAFWCLRGTLLGDPASDAEGREARSGCHGLTAGEPEARQGRGEQHAEATFLDRESCREVSRIIRGEFSQTKQGVEGEGGQRVGGGDKDTGIPHQPLYTIVCGSESGLDMDCVDSVQRDAMYCGMGPHLGLHERLLDNVQILPEDVKRDAMSICWRKDLNCIDQYFRKRQEMQREVYKSPEVMAATHMIAEILVLAADHLGLADKLLALDQSTAPHIIKALEEGRPLQGLQDFKQAMQDFFALNDFVLCELERTICSSMATGGDCVEKGAQPKLEKAQGLLKRLMHEDFYLHVASATLCCTARVSPELIMMARPEELQGETPLHPDQVLVDCVTISWTDTGCTPVLFWYSEARKDSSRCSSSEYPVNLLPAPLGDRQVYLYIRGGDGDFETVKNLRTSWMGAFSSFCRKEGSKVRKACLPLEKRAMCFKDHVYGRVEFDRKYIPVISHPYYQRMRYIAQLGATPYVYYGGAHTRFEHSLGVGHLARRAATHLKRFDGTITEEDITVVTLAGLCHDLGHGPLSHMFEGVARKLTNNPKWNHEEMSCKLFSCICEDIRNEEPEELHISPSVEERVLRAIQGIRGEGPKGFLVDIVSNFRNGIDVDKLDYLARDARYTNFTAGQKVHQFHRSLIEGEVEHDRIKCMRVVDGQLSWHIDSRHDIAGVYLERAAMHDNAYLHRQAKAIEYMLLDAFLQASGDLRPPISDCIKDPRLYAMLRDDLVTWIENRPGPSSKGMTKAKQLVNRLRRRRTYQSVFEVLEPGSPGSGPSDWQAGQGGKALTEADIIDKLRENDLACSLQPEDIFLWKKSVGCIKGNDNPLRHVPFHEISDDEESGEPQAAEVTDEELDNLLSRNPTKDKHILYLKDKDTTAACMHEDGVIAAFQQCLASWFGKDVSEVARGGFTPIKNRSCAKKRASHSRIGSPSSKRRLFGADGGREDPSNKVCAAEAPVP